MSRLDRVSTARAANAIIIVGLLLVAGSVLAALMNAYSDQYVFAPTGGAPGFNDRLRTFLNAVLEGGPRSVLVVAAGFALRTYAQRTPPVAALPQEPPVPFEDLPVRLPEGQPITIDVVQASVDDEVWRR